MNKSEIQNMLNVFNSSSIHFFASRKKELAAEFGEEQAQAIFYFFGLSSFHTEVGITRPEFDAKVEAAQRLLRRLAVSYAKAKGWDEKRFTETVGKLLEEQALRVEVLLKATAKGDAT